MSEDEDLAQDLEESGEELEEEEPTPWVGEHKKVVFSAIDYNLSDLAEQAESGDLDLQPQYQRRLRWSDERKSRLIESFLLNVPIPPIFLSEETDGTYAVIDGKQRIIAINDFLTHGLKLRGLTWYTDLNGKTADDLLPEDRHFLEKRIPLRAVIILEQSPPDIRLETFKRLNTGGVSLNAQEIRNIAFRGPLNDLIMELSEDSVLQRLLKIRDPERSAMHQQMRDVELVLRFLAFRTSWGTFDGSIKGHMDSYMSTNREMNASEVDSLRDEFKRVLDVVLTAFGEHAFARYQPAKRSWRRQVVAAIYDAEMLAAQNYRLEQFEGRRDEVQAAMRTLFGQKKFQDATEAATNSRSAFEYRIKATDRALKRVAAGRS